MTNAPILRSVALQKALTLAPVRRQPDFTTFAATLSQATTTLRPTSFTHQGSESVPFQDMITSAAQKYGVRPALLAAIVKQESNFNPNAKSGVGAKGLTQLIDATARGLGVTDPFDPAQSLDGGARFLGGLLKQFKGNETLALAAYNAGPGAVQKIWRYSAIPGDTTIHTKGTGVRGAARSIMGGLMTSSSNVNFSGADSYLQAAMSGLAARQRTIANNIANIDTPNFKASEVRFEDALKTAINRGQADTAPAQSALNQSVSRSSLLDATSTRADGNNVDIDREMQMLSEANLTYSALTQVMSTRIGILRNVINGR